MSTAGPRLEHRFVPGVAAESRTLLLLHGTGGNEDDLIPLGHALLPGAALRSPRGQVLERGMPRFFRRLSEGVFDEPDLRARTAELAEFVESAVPSYGIDGRRIIAVGFSNGANIAASLLLLRPRVLAGAVLFRAMVPLVPEARPDLHGTRVLIGSGRADPLVPVSDVERLAAMLEEGGAEVTMHWENAGHQLTQGDVDAARAWLRHPGVA